MYTLFAEYMGKYTKIYVQFVEISLRGGGGVAPTSEERYFNKLYVYFGIFTHIRG